MLEDSRSAEGSPGLSPEMKSNGTSFPWIWIQFCVSVLTESHLRSVGRFWFILWSLYWALQPCLPQTLPSPCGLRTLRNGDLHSSGSHVTIRIFYTSPCASSNFMDKLRAALPCALSWPSVTDTKNPWNRNITKLWERSHHALTGVWGLVGSCRNGFALWTSHAIKRQLTTTVLIRVLWTLKGDLGALSKPDRNQPVWLLSRRQFWE